MLGTGVAKPAGGTGWAGVSEDCIDIAGAGWLIVGFETGSGAAGSTGAGAEAGAGGGGGVVGTAAGITLDVVTVLGVGAVGKPVDDGELGIDRNGRADIVLALEDGSGGSDEAVLCVCGRPDGKVSVMGVGVAGGGGGVSGGVSDGGGGGE